MAKVRPGGSRYKHKKPKARTKSTSRKTPSGKPVEELDLKTNKRVPRREKKDETRRKKWFGFLGR